jgi:hypothetical protein
MKSSKGKDKILQNTSHDTIGKGDFYGTGIRNKEGRIRDSFMNEASPENHEVSDPQNYPRSL